MKTSLCTLLVLLVGLSACSKKDDNERELQLYGAWTMNSQENQGLTVPATQTKTIDQFGSSAMSHIQLDIGVGLLTWIETNHVQVLTKNYKWSIDGSELILQNAADISEVRRLPFTSSATLLTLELTSGKANFVKTITEKLATKTAAGATKTLSYELLLTIPSTSGNHLEVGSQGTLTGVSSDAQPVSLNCTYNFQNKSAVITYSNKNETPQTEMTLTLPLEFLLTSKKENSLFTAQAQWAGNLYGKSITAAASPCSGSMIRDEFFVQLDVRCSGVTVDGTTTSASIANSVKCLF